MNQRTLIRASELAEAGRPFALATVVWREGPTSGQVGAAAVITADGAVSGWLGGACAQPTVVRAALEALGDGQPRLLALGLDHDPRPGVVIEPMACASEGALEVYVEPMLPSPLLVVVGRSPAVDALVSLAGALGWRTVVVDDGGDAESHPTAGRVVTDLELSEIPVDEDTFLVVATQGHYDEPAVKAALATPASYVGLVASEKRAAAVFEWLRERGVSDEDLSRIKAPAGLDLGPVEHEEIAVAVLAELVERKARGPRRRVTDIAAPDQATDPVCGMTVDVASAHFRTEHDGTTYYFCAAGCQKAFEKDPKQFLTVA